MDLGSIKDYCLAPLSETSATVIAAVIAFMSGVWATDRAYRQKNDELFFAALDFLKGGSQNRNLGIAAIELYWDVPRHRPLCVSLLTGSAIYLIRASEQENAAHEIYNLERIMALLLSKTPDATTRSSYEALRTAIVNELADRVVNKDQPTGLHIATPRLVAWEVQLRSLRK